jgi:hypothetical protein
MGARVLAKIVFVLEYDDMQGWGDDCTIGQLREQARKDAEQKAQRIIELVQRELKCRLVVQDIAEPWVMLKDE